MRKIWAVIFCAGMLGLIVAIPFWTQRQLDFAWAVPNDEMALANRTIDAVQRRNFPLAVSLIEPRYRPTSNDVLEKMAAVFPKEKPVRSLVTNYATQIRVSTDALSQHTITLGIRHAYANGSAMQFDFVFFRGAKSLSVGGAQFNYVPPQAAQINDITLASLNTTGRMAAVATGLLLDLFAFVTFCVCFAGPGPRWRWRWLWLLLTLVGIVRLNVNWTTGQSYLQIVSFVLPPFGFSRASLAGPWFMWFSFPIGAIVYWIRRNSLNATADRGVADIRSPNIQT